MADEDIRHAIRHSLVIEELDDDPPRYLVLGPDTAGRILEVVVLDRTRGPAAIHAMPMRSTYRRYLEEGST